MGSVPDSKEGTRRVVTKTSNGSDTKYYLLRLLSMSFADDQVVSKLTFMTHLVPPSWELPCLLYFLCIVLHR